MRRAQLIAAAAITAIASLGLIGEQIYLTLKARLAGVLMERALAATFEDGRSHRPWPGADFAPLARIELPRQEEELTILSGAGGGSLAFGVGHVTGTTAPGRVGRCALAGHRDGSFRVLAELALGDIVQLHTPKSTRRYRVTGRSVVDENESWVIDEMLGDGLSLITCWPFGRLLPGTKRYVVFCEPLSGVVPDGFEEAGLKLAKLGTGDKLAALTGRLSARDENPAQSGSCSRRQYESARTRSGRSGDSRGVHSARSRESGTQ